MPTRTDLLCKAKELGLKGYTAMSKDALEKFVEANMPKTIRVKRPKKKQVESSPSPESAPKSEVAPAKKIKVRKPKVANPMAAVDEAKKYLEELQQKRVAKGIAKVKKTVSKGIVKSALERAVIKYKLEKAMKKAQPLSDEEAAEKELEQADNVEDALFALARLNSGNEWDNEERYDSMFEAIRGSEPQYVDAIVEHLRRKGQSVKEIVDDMKNQEDGFTMYDDYVKENTSKKEFAKWKKSRG